MLAGTTVVRTKPGTHFKDTIFSASEESYEPIFSLITNLSDKDITLIREVVNRARKHPGNSDAILWKAYEMTRKILGEEGPSSPIDFLEAVLRDYNHVTGKDQDRQSDPESSEENAGSGKSLHDGNAVCCGCLASCVIVTADKRLNISMGDNREQLPRLPPIDIRECVSMRLRRAPFPCLAFR
jgi:hypothetical protein